MSIPLTKLTGVGLLGLVSLLGCSESHQNTNNEAVSPAVGQISMPAVQWPNIASRAAPSAAVEERIDALLAVMTLEQKIGQVIQPELRQITPEDIKKYHIGSVLNGGGAFPGDNKHATPADWIALADSYYNASMDASNGGIAIPIMWGTDAVHGHNNVIGATLFPHNIALGATRNPELIRQIAAVTAREVAVTGIDWNFAPTLAVARDDHWGRTYESYSENPAIVQSYGGVFVEGLQGLANSDEFMAADKVIGTAKHFIADGGTSGGVDRGDAQMTEQELIDIHLAGYRTAIAAGVQTVMASFNAWQGTRMHGHQYLLTDILKGQLGFDGLVVGDWNGHEFVPGCSKVSCAQAFNAGVDIFMAPDADWKLLFSNTLQQVERGEITSARLDDAVRRILRVKMRAGLFEKGAPSTRGVAGRKELIGAAGHRAIAQQAVRESLVLLKNNNQLLPLHPAAHILVAGDGADNIGKQSGGWTISWQGTGNTNADFPGGSSIYQGIAQQVTAAGGKVVLSETGAYEQKPDVAIVVFGENPYAEMQGDVADLAYHSPADIALLRKLKADGIPVVTLFISGRPLWVNPELNHSDAFVAIWQLGSEGVAVADVLFTTADGKINHDFKGKLSFSWPAEPTQSPLNVDQTDYQPLFAYDYGLTYQDKVQLAQLPEHAVSNLPARDQLAIFNNRTLAPWQLIVADAVNNEVALTGSSASVANIQVRAVDRFVQEDALRIQWNSDGRGRVGFYAPTRTDLGEFSPAQGALVMDIKVDKAPTQDVQLGMTCGEGCGAQIALTESLQSAAIGEWKSVSVALACFANKGAKLNMVLSPFYVTTAGQLDFSIFNVRVEKNITADIDCQKFNF